MNKTPLYEKHRQANARLIDFAGWEMPVQYTSIIQEHLFVRSQVGMFDLSHMGEIIVRGEKSLHLLQYVTCNDISVMEDGQVQYNVILNEKGGIVDDVTIYRVHASEYFVVSNATNYQKVAAHLKHYQNTLALACEVQDDSDNWALIAIQGPLANDFAMQHLRAEGVDQIPYYRFRDFPSDHTASASADTMRVSRTGYTGEDGFEIYTSPKIANELWDRFIQQKDALLPIGLGARDSLRMEVFYPLYGHELNEELTPVECNLKWIVKEKDCEYLAKEKILQQKKDGISQRVVGFRLPAGPVAREGYEVLHDDQVIGRVLSGLYSPSLKHGIGSALVKIAFAKKGATLKIRIREGQTVDATVHFGGFVSGSVRKN